MKVMYIAGAYRGKTVWRTRQNIKKAEEAAAKYWQEGFAVICPHKNSALMDGLVSEDHWLDAYIEILKRCDIILMLDNWRESEGAKQELKIAVNHGITVWYEEEINYGI